MFNSNKHRSAILLIVSVIAVAASVVLLPTWGEDAYAEEIGGFEVSDSDGLISEYADLGAAISEINNRESSGFTITALSDQDIAGPFIVNVGKNITLTSLEGEKYILTVTSAVRHFTVNGTLTLENIILDGNNTGGGIDVKAGGILTMNDGAVIQNCNSANGGGVNSAGTFTMNGNSVITGCTATSSYGGGVYNNGNSVSFTMNEGVISSNTAQYGGGVYNGNSVSFTMNGGKILDNIVTSVNGGGVYINSGAFTLIGGEISYNTAQYGGGVYSTGYGASFTMKGGEISNNTATKDGGGVYSTGNNVSFTMSGGVISGNKATGNGGGVHNYNSSSSITTTLAVSGGKISGNTATNGGGVYSYGGVTFDFSDGVISGNTATGSGGGVSGVFTMTGGEISGNKAGSGGGVSGGVTMTGGEISGNTASSGGGMYSSGMFTFENGKISGNTATNYGGGVYNSSNSFNMSGDAVISNNTANLGGGIYNTSSLNITSGTISDNTAKGADTKGSGGGIYTTNFTIVTVGDGVVFTGNTAPTLRGYDIPTGADIDNNKTADLDDYKKIGAVELDVSVSGYNAPAYNNYDINYPADVRAVKVSIVPNGSGTVTVTNNGSGANVIVYGILAEDEYVYVPTSVSTINISATPADGSVFVNLTVKGVQKTTTPYNNVTVVDGMLVNAEFKDLVFTITIAADDTSTISPGEDVTVSSREDAKFTFSADPGYEVTAVYVDDVPISPEELASGEYTFLSVIDNHTISVVSEAVAGNGSDDEDTDAGDDTGTGPSDGTGAGGSDGTGTGSGGDSTDTGSGGGTGSGPTHGTGAGTGGHGTGSSNGNGSAGNGGGTDVGGSGNIETGSEPNENENAGVTPDVTETGDWSVLSMIFAVIAVFTGMIALVAGRDRFRTDDEERRSKTGITLRVLALIIGIVSVIVLFVTEYGSMAPVAIGTWTPLMFVLLLATLILAMVSFRFDKADN